LSYEKYLISLKDWDLFHKYLPDPKLMLGDGGIELSMVDLQNRKIGLVSVPAE